MKKLPSVVPIEVNDMAGLGEDERRSDATTKSHHGPISPLQKIEEKLSSKKISKKNSPDVEGDEQEEDTKYGSSSESLDMLPSARFNILDRMQIPRISPSYLTQPHPQSILSQINSPYSRQTATHFSLDALRGISQINREEPNNGLYSKKSRKGKNNKEGKKRGKDSKKSERFEEEEASPLDFSTKRTKLQDVEVASRGFEKNGRSGGNQLRNRLSMKSPSVCEDLGSSDNAAVLNLSKESPKSSQWCKSESASCSSTSSSPLLPSMEVPESFVTSPRPATNPVTLTSPQLGGHSLFSTMNGNAALGTGAAGGMNGTAGYPLSFSPWANGVFSPCVSPVMNQPAFPSGTGMLLETNPSIFSHQIPTSNSSAIGFNPSAAFPFMSNMQGSKSQASGKPPPRPFKAYPNPNPKDLQSIYNNFGGLPLGPSGSTEALIHQQSQQAYVKFREQMIASSHQTRNRRGGQRSGSVHGGSSECGDDVAFAGPSNGNSSGDASMDDGLNPECQVGKNGQVKDRVYWERRKKNNEAAKRSRDARRAKEDEIAIRAAFLEQENLKLRFEASVLRQEITRLRHVLYTG